MANCKLVGASPRVRSLFDPWFIDAIGYRFRTAALNQVVSEDRLLQRMKIKVRERSWMETGIFVGPAETGVGHLDTFASFVSKNVFVPPAFG